MKLGDRMASRFRRGVWVGSMMAGCAALAGAQTPAASSSASAAATPAVAASTAAVPDHAESYFHYGLAKLYEEQAVQTGRQDLATQAIEQYKLALNADPDSRILANGLANLYFSLGRVKDAVEAAEAQIQRHPDDVDAHKLLGRTYLRSLGNGQGQQSAEMLEAAIQQYEIIAKLQPKDLETHLLLGQLYGLAQQPDKAEAEFKIAQSINPGSQEVVLSLARLYSEEGKLDKAAEVLAAIPADDRTPQMDFALAGIYDQLKRPKDAIVVWRELLQQDPDNSDARKALAQSLMAAGQTDEAAKVYAEILKTSPDDPQALIREAEIERHDGQYELALSTLKKAEAMTSDNLELEFDEGLDYDALGRYDEAAKMFQQALDSSASPDGKYSDADRSNRALFLDRLANVYREQGKTDAAIAVYQQMYALGGEYQARAIDNEVDTYRDAHNWPAALKVAADAAKAMPANHDVQLTYAEQLADAGKFAQAIQLAEAQVDGKPSDDRTTYFTIADMDIRAKRWKDAAAALDKASALAKTPEDEAFVDFYRGSLADRQKMFDQAEEELRKGLALEPDSGMIENYLGYLLADRGVHLDEAVTLLKKAVASDPQNYAYLDSLAWAYYKQGQYALAESFEQKALNRMSTDPTLLDHMGEIEAKNGKLQAAIDDWQKSLAAYASSLAPDADPADVAKVQKKLENARVRMARNNGAK